MSLSGPDTSRYLGWLGGEIYLAVPGDNLKHRFFDITHVEFWAVQEAEDDFAVPGEHMKYRFPDLNHVTFVLIQGTKMISKCHSIP